MITFKIGDTVLVVIGKHKGMTGEIVAMYGDVSPFMWLVKFGKDDTGLYRGDEIK